MTSDRDARSRLRWLLGTALGQLPAATVDEQLRWLRIVGDSVFLVGVGRFAWFMLGLWFGWSYQPTAETEPRTGLTPDTVPIQ
jgi:hypothetical protein